MYTNDELMNLSPSQLVRAAKHHISIAWMIFNNESLLNKLGYHVNDNRIFGSSSFWNKFAKEDKNDLNFSHYLCEFLMAHKEIYDAAKARPELMDRLSTYQEHSLKANFEGDSYRFHKYGKQ